MDIQTDKMDLEKIIIQTLIEYQFGENLKNGDYITGVKKMYFGEVAAMVVKKYNDIHDVVGQSEQLVCAQCNNKKALHSETTGLCPDRFKHFEAN